MTEIEYDRDPETKFWAWRVRDAEGVLVASSTIRTMTKFGAWCAARRTIKGNGRYPREERMDDRPPATSQTVRCVEIKELVRERDHARRMWTDADNRAERAERLLESTEEEMRIPPTRDQLRADLVTLLELIDGIDDDFEIKDRLEEVYAIGRRVGWHPSGLGSRRWR